MCQTKKEDIAMLTIGAADRQSPIACNLIRSNPCFVIKEETNLRILVAEDERDMNALLCRTLARAGYSVDGCFDGLEAMDCLAGAEYDCLILDVMMPKLDGHALVRKIRAQGNAVPVIFLTARDSIQDRITGLDLGADDYLVKPFDFDELLARIRAVTRGGTPIKLSAKEYAILEYLMKHQGTVVSRTQLENHVWNYDYEGGSNVVDVYITYLRKKLDGGFDKKLLHTVRGSGWVIREET